MSTVSNGLPCGCYQLPRGKHIMSSVVDGMSGGTSGDVLSDTGNSMSVPTHTDGMSATGNGMPGAADGMSGICYDLSRSYFGVLRCSFNLRRLRSVIDTGCPAVLMTAALGMVHTKSRPLPRRGILVPTKLVGPLGRSLP